MRVEHRSGLNKLVHKIDTDESYGHVEVVLPNGERLELIDSGGFDSIEIRLKPSAKGPWTQLSIEPMMGNEIRLRVRR